MHKQSTMLRILIFVVLVCLSPAASYFFRYPGYTGSDCPTARAAMLKKPVDYWMVPKCNKDGTFKDLQCYDSNGPDDCMCVYKDGTLLSLPRQTYKTQTCFCYGINYERYLRDKEWRMRVCGQDGYFNLKQCSDKTKECWCVTKYGTVIAPPSKDRKSCDDVAELY